MKCFHFITLNVYVNSSILKAALASLATPADPDLKERLEHLVRMVLLAKTEIPALQAIKYKH